MIFKAIEQYGVCSEIDFEFNQDNLSVEPTQRNYSVAECFKFIQVYRIKNDLEFMKLLIKNDMPLMIGMVLYTDLIKIVDKLWMPDFSIDKRIGGTSGLIVGYSDDRSCFFVKFAYGKDFGSSGYILVPYEYVQNIDLVPEIYYLDLKKNRIEGFLNQRRETVSLESKMKENDKTYNNSLESFFS